MLAYVVNVCLLARCFKHRYWLMLLASSTHTFDTWNRDAVKRVRFHAVDWLVWL